MRCSGLEARERRFVLGDELSLAVADGERAVGRAPG